jgi:hypothetical protein
MIHPFSPEKMEQQAPLAPKYSPAARQKSLNIPV